MLAAAVLSQLSKIPAQQVCAENSVQCSHDGAEDSSRDVGGPQPSGRRYGISLLGNQLGRVRVQLTVFVTGPASTGKDEQCGFGLDGWEFARPSTGLVVSHLAQLGDAWSLQRCGGWPRHKTNCVLISPLFRWK